MSRLLLVDGNNLAIRSSLAMAHSDLASADGTPTGGLMTFINSITKYARDLHPDFMMVCWDNGRSAYRHAIYPEYKAGRGTSETSKTPDSYFQLLNDFLTFSCVPYISKPNVEGDDIIAYYWRNTDCDEVHIVSGDKDFYQLLDQRTTIHRPGEPDPWTWQRFMDTHGFDPEKMRYVQALMGDKVDGIPGLKRVGMATAVKILKEVDWDWYRLLEVQIVAGIVIHPLVISRNLALIDLVHKWTVGNTLELPDIPHFRPNWEPGSPGDLLQFLTHYNLEQALNKARLGTLWRNPVSKTKSRFR